ncbi:MAG: hypothetical protein ACLTDR_04745 [Adlercreutzia equolifaciens]
MRPGWGRKAFVFRSYAWSAYPLTVAVVVSVGILSWGPSTAPSVAAARSADTPPPRAWVWELQRRRRRGLVVALLVWLPLSWASGLVAFGYSAFTLRSRSILPACWRWSSCSCSSRYQASLARFCWGGWAAARRVETPWAASPAWCWRFLRRMRWIPAWISYARGGARRGHLHAPVYWLGEGLHARRWAMRRGRRRKVSRACGPAMLLLFAAAAASSLRRARGRPDARDQRRRQERGNAAESRCWRGSAVGAVPGSRRRALRRGRCAARCAGMRYRLGALLSICSGGELVAQYGLAHLGA